MPLTLQDSNKSQQPQTLCDFDLSPMLPLLTNLIKIMGTSLHKRLISYANIMPPLYLLIPQKFWFISRDVIISELKTQGTIILIMCSGYIYT